MSTIQDTTATPSTARNPSHRRTTSPVPSDSSDRQRQKRRRIDVDSELSQLIPAQVDVIPNTPHPTNASDAFDQTADGPAVPIDVSDNLTVMAPKADPGSPSRMLSPRGDETGTSSIPPEPLSAYTCPICFAPPTNATLTPCGHICCGACLFTAVKSTIRRNMAVAMDRATAARCPVCRAEIPGWDGRGGGVIGLKMRVLYSL